MSTTTTIRPITLSDNYYEPRRTLGGGEVRDAMPYEGAVEYVTDDAGHWGVRYEDGGVDWLGEVALALPESVQLVAIPLEQVSASDLRAEIETCRRMDEPCEAYRIRLIGASGYEQAASTAEVLYLPDVGRGGVDWGGGAGWTDADTPEEVVWRSLLAEML